MIKKLKPNLMLTRTFHKIAKSGDILLFKDGETTFIFEEWKKCKWQGSYGICKECPGKVKGKRLSKFKISDYDKHGFCERTGQITRFAIIGNAFILEDNLFEV